MVNYTIANTASGSNITIDQWDGTGTARLVSNISITSSMSPPYNIGSTSGAVIFDGAGYKISIASDIVNFSGIFQSIHNTQTITIQNLLVQINSTSTTSLLGNASPLFYDNASSTYTCNINNCATIGPSSNSYIFYLNNDCGGIFGRTISDNLTLNISNCYSSACAYGTASGCILGAGNNLNPTITIENCYSTGEIYGFRTGGIAGTHFGSQTNNPCIIRNCYSTGAINGQYAGGIAGFSAADSNTTTGITILNCYVAGNTGNANAGMIIGYPTGKYLINKCYSKYAIDTSNTIGTGYFLGFYDTDLGSITNCGAGNGTWNSSIGSDLVNTGTNTTNIWDTGVTPYKLNAFESNPWLASTYTTYTSLAMFDASSFSYGDPHIKPLIGELYDLSIIGAYRHFDNCNKNNRLIINGLIAPGLYAHTHLNYIRKLYIQQNDKNIEIDMGFRGELMKIINNNGFDVKEYKLNMAPKIIRKCIKPKCKYFTFTNRDSEISDHNDNDGHYVPLVIRNCIEINISIDNDNEYTIILSNVNYNNRKPCAIELNFKYTNKFNDYFGACIKERDHNLFKLNSLYDISILANL